HEADRGVDRPGRLRQGRDHRQPRLRRDRQQREADDARRRRSARGGGWEQRLHGPESHRRRGLLRLPEGDPRLLLQSRRAREGPAARALGRKPFAALPDRRERAQARRALARQPDARLSRLWKIGTVPIFRYGKRTTRIERSPAMKSVSPGGLRRMRVGVVMALEGQVGVMLMGKPVVVTSWYCAPAPGGVLMSKARTRQTPVPICRMKARVASGEIA